MSYQLIAKLLSDKQINKPNCLKIELVIPFWDEQKRPNNCQNTTTNEYNSKNSQDDPQCSFIFLFGCPLKFWCLNLIFGQLFLL
jgi:hypothetical protein